MTTKINEQQREWPEATHQITIETGRMRNRKVIEVRLVDGVAYTQQEWESESPADWEVVDGEWLFQGSMPVCESYVVREYAPASEI